MNTLKAFRTCEKIARTHYENFTVGSLLMPFAKRRHVYNLYAYCRTVDDLGDEAEGDRVARLKNFEAQLRKCYSGTPDEDLFVALQDTIRRFDIPIEPFLKLVKANVMDQSIHRFSTFDDLLFYCDHSANPCGRLFLYVFGYRDERRQTLSDNTCAALQLTNFWQDVAIDWKKGRVYIPQEDLKRFGVSEKDLARGRATDDFKRLLKFEVDRTRELFVRGLALLDHVNGKLKVDIKLFTLGGMSILDAIEKADYDVFAKRPTLSKAGKIKLLVATVLGIK